MKNLLVRAWPDSQKKKMSDRLDRKWDSSPGPEVAVWKVCEEGGKGGMILVITLDTSPM
jgi:hypothetical protein